MSENTSPFVRMLVERSETRTPPAPPVETVLPAEDEIDTADENDGYAEGQSFAIEYRDGTGQFSRRRITVWSIKRNAAGIPVLQAMCHERKAFRPFRVDRIVSCIDYDGEVFDDIPAFMFDTFGMQSWSAPAKPVKAEKPRQPRWIDLRNKLKTEVTLLVALAHADGTLLPSEFDMILGYAGRIAKRENIDLTEELANRMIDYIRRLAPVKRTILDAIQDLMHRDPEEIQTLLIAGLTVIDADGERHESEIDLLNAFAEDCIGLPIV